MFASEPNSPLKEEDHVVEATFDEF